MQYRRFEPSSVRQHIFSFNINYLACGSEPHKPRKSRLYSRARASAAGRKVSLGEPFCAAQAMLSLFSISAVRHSELAKSAMKDTRAHIICVRINDGWSFSAVRLSIPPCQIPPTFPRLGRLPIHSHIDSSNLSRTASTFLL